MLFSSLNGSGLLFGQDEGTGYYQLELAAFREFKPFNEDIDIKHPDYRRINAAIYWVTNETRAKNGCTSLKFLPELEYAATIHSDDMVKYNFFDHYNNYARNRRSPDDRARIAGIVNPAMAENIIEGYLLRYQNNSSVRAAGPGEFTDPGSGIPLAPHTYLSLADELVSRWMDSKGHRKNVLSEDAVETAVGVIVYLDAEFNDMPSVMATQLFQLFKPAIIQ